MNVLKLDMTGETDEFFEDAHLIGIMSSLKNYKFCWQVNTVLGYNFRLNPFKEVMVVKKTRKYFFPVYQQFSTNSTSEQYIYHNQFEGEFLLPEFKHMDFLWLIKGSMVDAEQVANIINNLKKIDNVQLAIELQNEQIKNKAHLMF